MLQASSSSQRRGFSLIELLLVVALGALLAAFAAPGMRSLRRNAALAATADQLLGALYFAQSAAARENVPTSLCLAADAAHCLTTAGAAAAGWLLFFDLARKSPVQFLAADEKLSSARLPVGIELTGSRPAVTFWPTARAGTTATFTICDSRDRSLGRTVVVSQTGRPRVAPQMSAVCAG